MTVNPFQFKNETVSPNQLAFQGLEAGAHPTARFARMGYSFKMEHHAEENPHPERSHTLVAYAPHRSGSGRMVEAASLEWAGREPGPHLKEPGEIAYVGTDPGHRERGLASALFQHATDTNLGQETRPVHSRTRTPMGKGWSAKVGGFEPGEAPHGYHPFQANEPGPDEDVYSKRAKAKFNDRRLFKAGHRPFPEMDTE